MCRTRFNGAKWEAENGDLVALRIAINIMCSILHYCLCHFVNRAQIQIWLEFYGSRIWSRILVHPCIVRELLSLCILSLHCFDIFWFGDRKGIWLVTGNPRRVFWTPLWDPISSKIGHLIRHHHCMFYLCMCREAAWRCPRMVRFGTRCVKFLCPISRMSRPNLILFSRWMILFYTMTCKYKVYNYRYTGAVFCF